MRTHGKNLQGSHASGTALSRVWSIMKLILRFSISIIKDWSAPHLCRCLPILSRWPVTVTSNGSTTLYIRSKHSGAEQMVSNIHQSSDGGLDVRNPHALEMADSVNSKFFAPVGNTLITSRETKELLCTNGV